MTSQLYLCGECGIGYMSRATALRCHPYIAGVAMTDASEFILCNGGCGRKLHKDTAALYNDDRCSDCWLKDRLATNDELFS